MAIDKTPLSPFARIEHLEASVTGLRDALSDTSKDRSSLLRRFIAFKRDFASRLNEITARIQALEDHHS